MLFNLKAILKLRKRENLSQPDLAKLLRGYSKENGYGIKFDKTLI